MNVVLSVVEVVGAALRALGTLAPEILRIFIGDTPVDDLVDRARRAAKAIPIRTGPGGQWDADLDVRVGALEDE